MSHLTIVRLLVISGLALSASCLSVSAYAQSAWLPALPAQTKMEEMSGGMAVNGVHLAVTLAVIPLSLEHARRRIAREWGTRDDDVRSMPFRDGWLLSRRVGSNHDTVTLQSLQAESTRAVFSRANLAVRVMPTACQFAVPRQWVLISATRSTLSGAATDQCVYRRAEPDRDAFAGLDVLWKRDGWRQMLPAPSAEPSALRLVRWIRQSSRRTAILEPGGVQGLLLIMAGASAP
jgi:hypothetical protein